MNANSLTLAAAQARHAELRERGAAGRRSVDRLPRFPRVPARALMRRRFAPAVRT